jgi:precorrin-3B synthase
MSLTVPYEIKGWCPGVQRPMQSGDGLLVRVRPWAGTFTLEQAAGLADIAATLGNAHIDLTRRANLQIRGLTGERSPALRDALDRLGLLEAEDARNVMVDPLAGPEVRALALALGHALPHDLPAKFGCLVDGGGPLSIAGERADIALCLTSEGVAVRIGGDWRGATTPDRAVAAAIRMSAFPPPSSGEVAASYADGGGRTHAASRPSTPSVADCRTTSPEDGGGKLARMTVLPVPGRRLLGRLGRFTGVAAPFGRLEATQLRMLVERCARAGASEIRLSPWRALYVDAAIEDTGLIVDDDDPLLRVESCPGAPDCGSATVDTRSTARRVAALGIPGSIHVSGCAKGCARSAPADLVLVGNDGRYGVVRNGTARDRVSRTVGRNELATLLDA